MYTRRTHCVRPTTNKCGRKGYKKLHHTDGGAAQYERAAAASCADAVAYESTPSVLVVGGL